MITWQANPEQYMRALQATRFIQQAFQLQRAPVPKWSKNTGGYGEWRTLAAPAAATLDKQTEDMSSNGHASPGSGPVASGNSAEVADVQAHAAGEPVQGVPPLRPRSYLQEIHIK